MVAIHRPAGWPFPGEGRVIARSIRPRRSGLPEYSRGFGTIEPRSPGPGESGTRDDAAESQLAIASEFR